MAGKFRWKRTFIGSWHLIEDNHHWKTKFDGKQPSTEDNIQQKTTLYKRQTSSKRTSMINNLGLKMISYEKWYSMGDDIVVCLHNDPNLSSSILTKSIGLLKDLFHSKLSLYYKHDRMNNCTDWVTSSFLDLLTAHKNTVFIRSSCLIN